MCGITGIYHFKNSKTVDERTLVTMRDTLTHRGPDDAGVYLSPNRKVGFGTRRLKIIDLSDAGHMPMGASAQNSKFPARPAGGEIRPPSASLWRGQGNPKQILNSKIKTKRKTSWIKHAISSGVSRYLKNSCGPSPAARPMPRTSPTVRTTSSALIIYATILRSVWAIRFRSA